MALQTSGEVTVDVDRARAFAFVQDAERLAACIPGCRELQEVGPGRYTALLTSRVAFMTVSFKATIEVVKVDPPHSIDATITGDAVGLPGHMDATARMTLDEVSPSQTVIHYLTDVGLAGKLGGLGEPVFRATSRQLAREFAANLKKAIEATP